MSPQSCYWRVPVFGLQDLQSGTEAVKVQTVKKVGAMTVDSCAYLVRIVFRNLSAYNSHFVLQYFLKEYTAYTMRTGDIAYTDIGVIILNG